MRVKLRIGKSLYVEVRKSRWVACEPHYRTWHELLWQPRRTISAETTGSRASFVMMPNRRLTFWRDDRDPSRGDWDWDWDWDRVRWTGLNRLGWHCEMLPLLRLSSRVRTALVYKGLIVFLR
jgi:hypothetical protein